MIAHRVHHPFADSHAHLDAFVENNDWPAAWERAQAAGVDLLIAIGGSDTANARALQAAQAHAGIYAVLGYDRDEAERQPDVEPLRHLLKQPGAVGVGETGLDYHYSADTASQQCALLERQLDLACETALPVVIHTREAEADTLHLLGRYVTRWSGRSAYPGVIHCYTGGLAFARSLMDLGFMMSFSGIVTFKKADELREVLKRVPDDRLLIETDAPYLAPVPMRGRPNEPAYVTHVAAGIADVLSRPLEDIAEITLSNARRLFLPES
jgi:TatD DNase family protein